MSKSSAVNWLKVLGVLGLGVVAVTQGPKLLRRISNKKRLARRFHGVVERVDHSVGWDKLPRVASILPATETPAIAKNFAALHCLELLNHFIAA
jgi:hypothetical protein